MVSRSFVSGDYFNVIYLHHEYKTSYEVYSNEDIEPIQLTEEWLVKFGFEESEFVLAKICISLKACKSGNAMICFYAIKTEFTLNTYTNCKTYILR
jgi:hypothetical protein